jgi:hypothetical protein
MTTKIHPNDPFLSLSLNKDPFGQISSKFNPWTVDEEL